MADGNTIRTAITGTGTSGGAIRGKSTAVQDYVKSKEGTIELGIGNVVDRPPIIPRSSSGIDPALLAAMNQKKDDDALVKAALLQALNNQKRSEEKKPEETKPDPKLQEMLKKLGEKLDKLEKDSKENNGGTLPDAVKSFMDTVKEIKEQFAKGNYKLTDEQIQKLHEEAAAAKQSVGDNTPLEKQIDGITDKVDTTSKLGTLTQAAEKVTVKDSDGKDIKLSETKEFEAYKGAVADRANGNTTVDVGKAADTFKNSDGMKAYYDADGENARYLEHQVEELDTKFPEPEKPETPIPEPEVEPETPEAE